MFLSSHYSIYEVNELLDTRQRKDPSSKLSLSLSLAIYRTYLDLEGATVHHKGVFQGSPDHS